jgi:hypothetical protein
MPSKRAAPVHQITLNEEEIADVSLGGTFYIFDKEASGPPRLGDHNARARRGLWGCRGCRRCREAWPTPPRAGARPGG